MNKQLDDVYNKILEYEKKQDVLPGVKWMKYMQQITEWSSPLKVEISLTANCNQHCVHCSQGGHLDSGFFEERFIDEILKMQPGYVVLTGGEPLLHPNIKTIIRRFKERGCYIKICTNGSLIEKLSDKNIFLNMDKFDVIQISFDASDKDTYNRIRRGNFFEQVIRGVKFLKEKYPNILVELHCVPTQQNIIQIEEIYSIACGLDVDYFSLAPLAPIGNAKYIAGMDTDSLVYLHLRLLERNQKEKVRYIGCPYEMASLYGKISSEHNYHEKEYSCMAGYSTIYIDWNGDVFPCVYMKNKAFYLGHLSQGCKEILSNIKKRIQRFYVLENEPCSTCYLWGKCTGGCIGIAYSITGVYQPGYDPRCALKS